MRATRFLNVSPKANDLVRVLKMSLLRHHVKTAIPSPDGKTVHIELKSNAVDRVLETVMNRGKITHMTIKLD